MNLGLGFGARFLDSLFCHLVVCYLVSDSLVCVFVYVYKQHTCLYSLLCAHIHPQVWACGGQRSTLNIFLYHFAYFKRYILSQTWRSLVQAEELDSQALGWMCAAMPSFYVGAGNPSPASLACAASPLSSMPAPKSHK